MPVTRGLGFLGRIRERERLDAVLSEVREGRSAVLVIRGEAGIGKTALLRYAAREASGLRITEIEGVQVESELAFAGIRRLCAPMLDALDLLAVPQRNALRVALDLAAGDAPDKFLVALAVLNLLAVSAEERPVLALVDDAQWLDVASAQVLGFVARRLAADSVALLFALREPVATHALDGLPQLPLQGLDARDARALLARAVPGPLDDHVRDRIIAETHGNPLALVELSQRMSPSERARGIAPPATGDLPSVLEEQYLERVVGLPDETQRLLLLAAADPVGDPTVLWRAAERLRTGSRALAPARRAGLLEIGDGVRFHHPLVRSAVYRAASADERRRAHHALAEVSDPRVAADRRAWHRALAAAGPDEAVAADLERSAMEAQRRGGLAAGAALLERAVTLTPDPARQAGRALGAAEAAFYAGELEATQRLLARAADGPLHGFERARMTLLRGQIATVSAYGNEGAPLLLEAAKQLEAFDLGLARRAYLTAYSAAVTAHHLGGAGVLEQVCRAVRALPPLPADAGPLDLALDGLVALILDPPAVAMPVLRRASERLLEMPVQDVLLWGWFVGGVRTAMWDDDAIEVYTQHARLVRDAGALSTLPIQLQSIAMEGAWRGDLGGARRLMAESESISIATGTQVPPFAMLRILAMEGREVEASALIAATIDEGTARGQGIAVMDAHFATALLHNGLGNFEQAAAAAAKVFDEAILPILTMWAAAELIEAAGHVGDSAAARAALNRLSASAQAAGGHLALGIEARCRALLARDTDAEALHRKAIERLERTGNRTELARAHLGFGEWLRGQGRLREARDQLRTAADQFAGMGMEGFAERAEDQLAAARGRRRRHSAAPRDDLTAQEEQIAHLARLGLTNAEIGAQLFLSARTVEWHLSKVFNKLGIDARSALAAALPEDARTAAL